MVALPVTEVAATERFLHAVFGWTTHPRSSARLALFRMGNGPLLALGRVEDFVAELGLPEGAVRGRTALLACNVRTAEEVAARLDRAVAAGGKLVRSSAPTAWGGVAGCFADPEGHFWEVVWNPGWPLDAAGQLT